MNILQYPKMCRYQIGFLASWLFMLIAGLFPGYKNWHCGDFQNYLNKILTKVFDNIDNR